MYNSISGSNDTLFNQAPNTVKAYFEQTLIMVDTEFGEGFAAKNPDLVAKLVSAMVQDAGQMFIARALEKISDSIDGIPGPLDRIADKIEEGN